MGLFVESWLEKNPVKLQSVNWPEGIVRLFFLTTIFTLIRGSLLFLLPSSMMVPVTSIGFSTANLSNFLAMLGASR